MKNYPEQIKQNRINFTVIRWLKFALTFILIFIFVFYGIHAGTRMLKLHDTTGLVYSSLLFILGVVFLLSLKPITMKFKMGDLLKYLGGELLNPPVEYEEKFSLPNTKSKHQYSPLVLWRKNVNGVDYQLERFFQKSVNGCFSREMAIFRITGCCNRNFELFIENPEKEDSDVIIMGQKFSLNCDAYDGMLEHFLSGEHDWSTKLVKLFVRIDPDAVFAGTEKSLMFACDYEALLAYSFTAVKIKSIFDLLKEISASLEKLPPVERRYEEGTGILKTKILKGND